MAQQPISYLQTDPRWKNASYATKGEVTTIGASGCGPTSMAMALATWADPAVTPLTECAWALAHGYKAKGQGTYYSYFVPAAKRYGLTCTQLNGANIYGNAYSGHHATAKSAVDAGDLVIACMGKGTWTRSGHYVVVWKIDGNTVYINDPASTATARTRGNYATFRKEVKYYWVIHRPSWMKGEEPDMTEEQTRKIVKEEVAAQMGVLKEPVYNTAASVPDWARATVEKLLDRGAVQGTAAGLGLSLTMLRQLVINDRMGVYD